MNPDSPAAPLLSAVTWISEGKALHEKAGRLAEKLQLPLIKLSERSQFDLLLCYTEDGLQLQITGKPNTALLVNFLSDSLAYRRKHGGGIKQALARAVGIKSGVRPSILDATAGLGRDSFLLASLGCKVTMIERSPLLAALLKDGLKRAEKDLELQRTILNKLTLLEGEAAQIIPGLKDRPDTIYLDPMYPHKRKSALNKQEMRIIRKLVGDDSDAGHILTVALDHARKRVVVKRPKGAPLLNDVSPTHVIKMKNSRYDVYMI